MKHNWQASTCSGKSKQFRALGWGRKERQLNRPGLYVQGGTAPYPTVMQTLAVPAKLAGVKRIVGLPPRGKNYEVIVAAKRSWSR